jgi:hypothetical protein
MVSRSIVIGQVRGRREAGGVNPALPGDIVSRCPRCLCMEPEAFGHRPCPPMVVRHLDVGRAEEGGRRR